MGFEAAVRRVFGKYADFSGRAPRSEYWWWQLFTLLAAAALSVADTALFSVPFLGPVFSIGILLPSLAVSVRRLHDLDRSGWFLLIALIPLIGALVLLVWFVSRGTGGPNRFGPDPLEAAY
ncbi:DUF805 domain-containing protein [Thermaurantiacus sp.]